MHQAVKFRDTELSSIGYGCMGLTAFYGATNPEESKRTLRKAIEISDGCLLLDSADMYAKGANEELIGEVLKEGNNREKVFLVTKFGNRWGEGIEGFKVDGSAEYVALAIDASIKRLGCTPDAWALHRVDKTTPIEETVKAMNLARKQGKTKYIGLSECSAETLLRASRVVKIDFIEVEYSPFTTIMENNGVLSTAAELGITVLAYSPLGRGFLTGRYKSPSDFKSEADVRGIFPRLQEDVWEDNYRLVEAFEKLAKRKGCTNGQLCLAWLLAQGKNIVPIPGTKTEKYLIENFQAKNLELSKEELVELRRVIDEFKPKGERYHAKAMAALDG